VCARAKRSCSPLPPQWASFFRQRWPSPGPVRKIPRRIAWADRPAATLPSTGTTAQFKNGNLGLYGNILLAASGGSYLNFGATSGSTGYGVRDNNGTLEFKNTGGSWINLTNTVTNVLGIDAISQIKFADGIAIPNISVHVIAL
jgi:hypothetical protein